MTSRRRGAGSPDGEVLVCLLRGVLQKLIPDHSTKSKARGSVPDVPGGEGHPSSSTASDYSASDPPPAWVSPDADLPIAATFGAGCASLTAVICPLQVFLVSSAVATSGGREDGFSCSGATPSGCGCRPPPRPASDGALCPCHGVKAQTQESFV